MISSSEGYQDQAQAHTNWIDGLNFFHLLKLGIQHFGEKYFAEKNIKAKYLQRQDSSERQTRSHSLFKEVDVVEYH